LDWALVGDLQESGDELLTFPSNDFTITSPLDIPLLSFELQFPTFAFTPHPHLSTFYLSFRLLTFDL
jgi:hypothetical protein